MCDVCVGGGGVMQHDERKIPTIDACMVCMRDGESDLEVRYCGNIILGDMTEAQPQQGLHMGHMPYHFACVPYQLASLLYSISGRMQKVQNVIVCYSRTSIGKVTSGFLC